MSAFASCGHAVAYALACCVPELDVTPGTMYQGLGCNHFDRRSTDRQRKRLVKRLADLGYAVEIKPLAA